jgi:alpha-1,2-mannosyltransferase
MRALHREIASLVRGYSRQELLLLIALMCFSWTLALIVAVEPLLHPSPSDFLSFYYAASAAKQHLDFYDASVLRALSHSQLVSAHVYPYLYPPPLAQMLRPLADLPLNVAYGLWLMMLLLGVPVSSILTWVVTAPSGYLATTSSRLLQCLLLTLVCVAILPVRNNIAMGQVNLIVIALLALMLASQLTQRPLLVGIFLSIAVLIKVTPIVFVGFFIVRRAFKVVLTFVVASVLLVLVSLNAGGVMPWQQYIIHTSTYGFRRDIPDLFPAAATFNFSPLGELARIVANRDWAGTASMWCAVAAFLTTVGLSFWARGKDQELLALSLFPIVMLFVSPLTYLHHLSYLSISAVIWSTVLIKRGGLLTLACVILVLGIGSIDWPLYYDRLGELFRRPGLRAINLYAIVVLYVIVVVEYQRSKASAQAPRLRA